MFIKVDRKRLITNSTQVRLSLGKSVVSNGTLNLHHSALSGFGSLHVDEHSLPSHVTKIIVLHVMQQCYNDTTEFLEKVKGGSVQLFRAPITAAWSIC